jgi:predicted O-linked N-acetylglucosamine transferase (SPINDLY family)
MRRYQEALQRYERAISLQPNYAEALHNRGQALTGLSRFEEALAAFEQAVQAAPGYADAHFHRGVVLATLGRHRDAIGSFDTALSLEPDHVDTMHHRGNARLALGHLREAMANFDSVLRRRPDSAEVLINMGIVLARLERYEDAITAYDRALALEPRSLTGRYNRANTLAAMRRFEDAIPDCEAVLAADPDYAYARGVLIYCKLQVCDWKDLADERRRISAGIRQGKRILNPQQNLAVSTVPAEQKRCAELWVANEAPAAPPLWRGERYGHDRIRVAYLSADFHNHATAHLMAGLFEQHDRKTFEVYGISFGPDDGSPMRQRLRDGIEHFVDMRQSSDAEIAAFLRKNEIDIAVDLKGYTEGARGVLAYRAAPVQVNYLGFPGTMGAEYVDYIIADPILIPDTETVDYTEKVVWLPDTYQCNDDKRPIASAIPTRKDCGLPDQAFVFCSFNANYKILPEVFEIWMRLLRSVPDSVLWLFKSNDAATRNLRLEAERRGVTSERLIFAEHCALPEHLARQKRADLFLDTLPYGAHTTASDALWAGLPVVTCLGTSFAGRVAASLLYAIGMPDLVADDWEHYEARAFSLASDPAMLADVKQRLAANRDTTALFDTRRFCRKLEDAFTTMHQQAQRRDPPASFAVP